VDSAYNHSKETHETALIGNNRKMFSLPLHRTDEPRKEIRTPLLLVSAVVADQMGRQAVQPGVDGKNPA